MMRAAPPEVVEQALMGDGTPGRPHLGGALLLEAVLYGWTLVPFACGHAIGQETLKSRWLWYLVPLNVFAFRGAAAQVSALESAASGLILARDAVTGRIGTYQAAFTIPNLNREELRLPISTVVLGSQKVPLTDALFNSKSTADTVHPLVNNGLKLLPSVTRVFSRSRDMHIFLQAYERNATETQPLIAFATFFDGDRKVFETAPFTVTSGIHERSKAVPVSFSTPLAALAPGRYEFQVTVLEPGGQKVAFWRAPIAIIP